MTTVVITGSTRGIGRGLAEAFAAKGCNVVVTGRTPGAVAETVAQLGGLNVVGRAGDVRNPDDLRSWWALATELFGGVDHWINNAAVATPRRPLWELADDEIESAVATNLTAPILACKVAIGGMIAQGSGVVWNVEGFGSTGRTDAGMTTYGATKRAIRYLHRSLLKELDDEPVEVGVISPGIVLTDLLTAGYDPGSDDWTRARRIFDILGDRVETVAPWIAAQVLESSGPDRRVEWLSRRKVAARFATAFRSRDVFGE